MLEEIKINPKNVSFVGDPGLIRQLAEQYGVENGVVYGETGVLGLEITNDELSKKILEKPPENAVIYKKPEAPLTKESLKERMKELYEKPKDVTNWDAEPGKVRLYAFPIFTTYCTDGKKDTSFGVAEGLKILMLDEDVSIENVLIAENEIGNIHSYFIGDTLTGAHNGVFGAITNFLGNNILNDEDLYKHQDLFIIKEEKIELSKKGEYISDCLKETWDNTPSDIRSLCKIGINKYLSELFAASSSITLEDLQKYIKEKSGIGLNSETNTDMRKEYLKILDMLRNGVNEGYFKNRKKMRDFCCNVQPMADESNLSDKKRIE